MEIPHCIFPFGHFLKLKFHSVSEGSGYARVMCRRGETTYAMGWLKWGPN
jgi:hypothetical protein